jgi:hypothetical protein
MDVMQLSSLELCYMGNNEVGLGLINERSALLKYYTNLRQCENLQTNAENNLGDALFFYRLFYNTHPPQNCDHCSLQLGWK